MGLQWVGLGNRVGQWLVGNGAVIFNMGPEWREVYEYTVVYRPQP